MRAVRNRAARREQSAESDQLLGVLAAGVAQQQGLPREKIREATVRALQAAMRHQFPGKETHVEWSGETPVLYVRTAGVPGEPWEAVKLRPGAWKRKAARVAAQVLHQALEEARAEQTAREVRAARGELVRGTVTARIPGGWAVQMYGELADFRGFLPEDLTVAGTAAGTEVCCVVRQTKARGREVVLNQVAPQVVLRLLEEQVPELVTGDVEVTGIVREAGACTKVAVRSNREDVDPVGACVGRGGERIRTVVEALREPVHVIPWHRDLREFAMAALAPAQAAGAVAGLDESGASRVEIAVPAHQMNLAIGKGGLNVRLAAKLCGCRITVVCAEKKDIEAEGVA